MQKIALERETTSDSGRVSVPADIDTTWDGLLYILLEARWLPNIPKIYPFDEKFFFLRPALLKL